MATAGLLEYGDMLGWDVNSCRSYYYMRHILNIEQPRFATLGERIRNNEKLFYPISDIKEVFLAGNAIQQIISCKECVGCRMFQGPAQAGNRLEEIEVVNSIKNDERPRFILLAILVCMNQPYIMRYFSGDRISDNNLDNMTNDTVIPRRELQAILPKSLDVANFIDRFLMLRRRFDLKTFDPFSKGRRLEFDESDILPFTYDEQHSESGFSIVKKFEIYPCYNNIYSRNNVKVTKFARKILKASITEEDFRYERDNLAFVNSLKNENIIEIFTWYTTKKGNSKKEFTYVFPYMDASLQDVLMGRDNVPEHLRYQQSVSLYSSQMWQQMVDITSALVAIHNPDTDALIKNGLQPAQGGWVGYHFDIKPSNILVDSKGKFFITDFGLSVFKGRGSDDTPNHGKDETEVFGVLAGTPAYQPPGTQQTPGILPPGEPQYDIPRMRREYDVWSLACVMTEVITYVLGYNDEVGSAAVLSFANRRVTDSTVDRSPAWHYRSSATNQSRLKPSVEDWFVYMRKLASADPDNQPSYLGQVLELLDEMFGINTRSSSTDVKQRLQDADKREKQRRDKAIRGYETAAIEEAPFSVTQWIKARGREKLIYDSEVQAGYRIFVRDYFFEPSSSRDSDVSGRIKLGKWIKVLRLMVFQSTHHEPRIRVVMTLKEQGRNVSESEGSVWRHERLIPLYRFDTLSPDFRNSLAFKGLFVDRMITFESPPDSHEFQKALLGYGRRRDFSMRIHHCSTDEERTPRNITENGGSIEVWTTKGVRDGTGFNNFRHSYDVAGEYALPVLTPIASPGYAPSITTSIRSTASTIPEGGRPDSMVVIFRSLPFQRDILAIPILQPKVLLCGGRPRHWGDPLYLSFIVKPNHRNFAILRLSVPQNGIDDFSMEPIAGVPGIPLELQREFARTRTEIDKITTFNRTCVSIKFETEQDRSIFIRTFWESYPSQTLFENAFWATLIKTNVIQPTNN